jgi:hypothetical protein
LTPSAAHRLAPGTLGVITKVSILTPTLSTSVNVCLLACDDYEKVP